VSSQRCDAGRNRVQSTHRAADLSWARCAGHGEPRGEPPRAPATPVIPVDDIVIGVVAAFAATAQAISGFGMNLILAPVMQMVAPGPAAVRLVVGLSAILNSAVLLTTRRFVLWLPALLLVIPALAATLLLGPVVSGGSSRVLGVVVAVTTLAAIAATALRRPPPGLTGRTGALAAGVLSGALNVSSGVSGPPIAAYAAAQPWTPRQVVATVQAVFLPGNVAAFIVLGDRAFRADLGYAGLVGTMAGTLAGARLRGRVPSDVVRAAVLVVAAAGAVIVLLRSA
jgi:uncharacterized protein